jgi:GGDEF domain-containing protein
MQIDTRNLVNEQLPKLLKPGNGTIAATVLLGIGILCWPFLALLMVVATSVIVIAFVVRTQNQIQSFELRSGIDPESSLPNREAGVKALELEAARAKDTGQALGVLLIALTQSDDTPWNDPDASERERIIRTAASEIKRKLSAYDLAARVGDTTFFAILPGKTGDRMLAVSDGITTELTFATMGGKVKGKIQTDCLAADEDAATFVARVKSLLPTI